MRLNPLEHLEVLCGRVLLLILVLFIPSQLVAEDTPMRVSLSARAGLSAGDDASGEVSTAESFGADFSIGLRIGQLWLHPLSLQLGYNSLAAAWGCLGAQSSSQGALEMRVGLLFALDGKWSPWLFLGANHAFVSVEEESGCAVQETITELDAFELQGGIDWAFEDAMSVGLGARWSYFFPSNSASFDTVSLEAKLSYHFGP